ATSGNIHFETISNGSAEAHASHGHAHADAAFDASIHGDHHEDKHEQPPTKYDNPKSVSNFQWFTDLFATPRYDEIDPTLVLATIFPLFFGFMIGDLGLGIVLIASGWALRKYLPRVDGMKQLGTAFLVAG